MRQATPSETPSLFGPDLLGGDALTEHSTEERAPQRHAREFVRWCWSAGGDFRNSPDRINLQFWAQKSGVALSGSDEDEILSEARVLFYRRVDQAARRAEQQS
jgi:hypothetical protein